jgi:1-acyl-sn-glycerol-3-phosphate acyltransferase
MVGAACSRDIYFLAKEELFRAPVLGPLIRAVHAIPIRRGVADLSGMSRALELLRGGNGLLMFPEGSRMSDGELHPGRPGVGMLAVNADVPIVPCYVAGTNRPGQWWNRRTRARIAFGPARHWKEFAGPDADLTPGRALYQAVVDGVMREIAILKAGDQNSASRGPVMSRTQSS